MRGARDRTPADLIEEETRGPPAELVEARAKRGQRRIGEIRDRPIVEADHRDVLRDAESGRPQDLHDADGIPVGPGHHRRARPGGALKELSGARAATGCLPVIDVDDQFGRARQSALRQRVAITLVPFRDRGILEPADEGDATVAVSDQVAHSFAKRPAGCRRRPQGTRPPDRGRRRSPAAARGGRGRPAQRANEPRSTRGPRERTVRRQRRPVSRGTPGVERDVRVPRARYPPECRRSIRRPGLPSPRRS